MLLAFGRRRFYKFFVAFSIILVGSLIISSTKHLDSILRNTNSIDQDHTPRFFCILLYTQSTDDRFVYLSNITWAKTCHIINVIKHIQLPTSNYDLSPAQTPYFVNLWTHVLTSIRQFITLSESIGRKNTLVIVPAPTFVFREKLTSLLYNSENNQKSPLIMIYEYQHTNAYILNDEALNLVRNTELIDGCLQKAYPSSRERQLWKCVKTTLSNEKPEFKCKTTNCFIQHKENSLRIADIKKEFCLQKNYHECQSIALLYPVTFNDMVTLEFFKYRLKPKP